MIVSVLYLRCARDAPNYYRGGGKNPGGGGGRCGAGARCGCCERAGCLGGASGGTSATLGLCPPLQSVTHTS